MPGQPEIHVAEPHSVIEASVVSALHGHGVDPLTDVAEIDSTNHIHDEASLLDETELEDAKAALIEDGLFSPDADLRAATKYSWAIAHAAQSPPGVSAKAIVWSVADGLTATTKSELRFIVAELQRRAIPVTHVAPCWPVSIEPCVDLGENGDAFLAALAGYAAIVTESGVGLFVPNAAGKFSMLPIIATKLGSHALLRFENLGWLAAARVLARSEPPLFREVLACAQEHFAFDKPAGSLATTEDDVRALPDVPDADLERFFLDDPRGRQLLHITAQSIFSDATLREPLNAFLATAISEIDAAVAASVEQHVAPV